MLGLDLYDRARAADRPATWPSTALAWSFDDAPRVAKCLHASAVVLDALKQFAPLPADLAPFQTAAHRRAQQLATQLQQSFRNAPVIPLGWRPADMDADVPVFVAAPAPRAAPAAPPAASLFPSVPKGPVSR